MFVAKLPGRQLLDDDVFASGDGATPTHLWWSGSGNDYNCAPVAGRNLDIKIPGLDTLTNPNATVDADLQVPLGHRVGLRLRLRA